MPSLTTHISFPSPPAAIAALRDPRRSLSWVAPADDASELATEDPLALDYVAQQVGLQLLPALTTRSSRAQAFAMVLFGLALADRAIAVYDEPATDAARRMLFERWERFWALATVEYRGGDIPRGDRDAMRGVRGALTAWRSGDAPLPLDFPLISRQQELANLGAYLAPLRRAGLVIEGSLRPSAAALEIIDAFWAEADNKQRTRYETYAMMALDRRRAKIPRQSEGGLTLRAVGKLSRLSSLAARKRTAQQARLFEALLGRPRAHDTTTQAVTALVEAAVTAGVTETPAFLDAAIAGRFGVISADLRDLLATARVFGAAVQALLTAFDRVYAAIQDEGWTAPVALVLSRALDAATVASTQTACTALLAAPRVDVIRGLPMHGAACIRLCEELVAADADATLTALLRYHEAVQRERRRGQGWLRRERDRLLLVVTSYGARLDADRFPSFKFDTVRSLLLDTGRVGPPTSADSTDEEADA